MPDNIYFWADRFRQKGFVLIAGVDYKGEAKSIAQQVRQWAYRHRYKVSVKIDRVTKNVRVTVRSRPSA